MAKSKQLYIEVFPTICNEKIRRVNKKIEDYKKNGMPKNAEYACEVLSDNFQVIAIGEIILNSAVVKAKQNFYLSAKMQEIIFKKYDCSDSSSVSTYRYRSLFNALISDNYELINSLALLFGGRKEAEAEDDVLFKNVLYAVKYLILEDINEAKKYVDELISMKDKKEMKLFNGYAIVLKSIIAKDESEINEGLKFMIECHKKLKCDYGGTPEELFSIPVLGLAKLAKLKSMNVDIDDPIAPKVILEKHEIEYPIIDFIN